MERYIEYVKTQIEAAVHHLANSFPYDNLEDSHADIPFAMVQIKLDMKFLKENFQEGTGTCRNLLQEARIAHLAYASEIAGAMLQRQQATAM